MDLTINERTVQVSATDDTALLWVLRDLLGMTGTKFGCGMALCGACTVHVDGKPVRACVLPVSAVVGKKITTIEGRGQHRHGPRRAGGLEGAERAPMRLLPGWADHVGRGAVGGKTGAERRRHRCCDVRKYLPLWDLYTHPCSHQAGCRTDGEKLMSAVLQQPAPSGLSRREFITKLTAAGGLVVIGCKTRVLTAAEAEKYGADGNAPWRNGQSVGVHCHRRRRHRDYRRAPLGDGAGGCGPACR